MAKDKPIGLTPKEALIEQILRRLNGTPPNVDAAAQIASNAFFGHKDRNGRSYFIHLLQAVRAGTDSDSKIIVGLLHDLVEDTDWTLDDLRKIGFSDHVVRAIDFVTKRPDEPYFDGVVRCGSSVGELPPKHKFLAVDVKLMDLGHNADIFREEGALSSDYMKHLRVYQIAYKYLVALKKERITPGRSMTGFMEAYPKLYNPELLGKNSSDPVRRMLLPQTSAAMPISASL